MKTALLKELKVLAKAARRGDLTSEEINNIVSKVDDTLRTARRKHITAKRDPKKVAAAVKKAAATRARKKKEHAKWKKIWEAERKAEAERLAAGYLHAEINECNAGVPNPKYYEYAYTDERSGGYEIYRLRPEYVNKPVPGAAMWISHAERDRFENNRWF